VFACAVSDRRCQQKPRSLAALGMTKVIRQGAALASHTIFPSTNVFNTSSVYLPTRSMLVGYELRGAVTASEGRNRSVIPSEARDPGICLRRE